MVMLRKKVEGSTSDVVCTSYFADLSSLHRPWPMGRGFGAQCVDLLTSTSELPLLFPSVHDGVYALESVNDLLGVRGLTTTSYKQTTIVFGMLTCGRFLIDCLLRQMVSCIYLYIRCSPPIRAVFCHYRSVLRPDPEGLYDRLAGQPRHNHGLFYEPFFTTRPSVLSGKPRLTPKGG